MYQLRKPLLMITGSMLLCLGAFAHDYWVDPGDFSPAVGAETNVVVCSGHSFPKISTDTHGYLVHDAFAMVPEGTNVSMTIESDDNRKSARIAFRTNGTYIVCLSMKDANKEEPSYWIQALVVVGNDTGDKNVSRIGKGMEIIMGSELSRLEVDDNVPLSVAYDGRKVRALVTITREDGTVSHIRSSPRRPAMLKIKKPGRYLVVASVAGKKCSLTFEVPKMAASNKRTGKD
jgi:hypothetical protein